MPFDSRKVSEEFPKESLGSLGGCLVEGDAEQRHRERRVRRRALVISILAQSAILTLLALVPLFGRTERIAAKVFVPIPPYGHPPHHSPGTTTHRTGRNSISADAIRFFSPIAPPMNPTNPRENTVGPPNISAEGIEGETGPVCSWCVNIGDRKSGPRPPQPPTETTVKPKILHFTQIDPAMLIRRVEPIYPTLAKQTHREGRVELQARIATDGSIQSLEVVGGDPMFYQSAKDAVSQWRYKPTILDGQPVEIDTHITVIYIMQH